MSGEFYKYLDNLENIGISKELANSIRLIWEKLCLETKYCIYIPCISPREDEGDCCFDFSSYNKVLNIQISKDGYFEWFFRDRKTNYFCGSGDDERCTDIPEELSFLLKHFIYKPYGFGERKVKCYTRLNINVQCARCGKELFNSVGEHDFSDNNILVEYCRDCALSTIYEIGTKEERRKLFNDLRKEYEQL